MNNRGDEGMDGAEERWRMKVEDEGGGREKRRGGATV